VPSSSVIGCWALCVEKQYLDPDDLASLGRDRERSGMLAAIRQARTDARDRAWLARGELTGSELPGSRAAGKTIAQVVIDLDDARHGALTWTRKAPGATSRAGSATTRSERGWTTPTRPSLVSR